MVPARRSIEHGNRLGFAVTSLLYVPLLESMARAHAHSSTVMCDALWSLPSLRRGVKLGWRACRAGRADVWPVEVTRALLQAGADLNVLATPAAHPWQPHEPRGGGAGLVEAGATE